VSESVLDVSEEVNEEALSQLGLRWFCLGAKGENEEILEAQGKQSSFVESEESQIF